MAARGDGVAADGSFHAGAAPGDVIKPDGVLIVGPHHAAPACQHSPKCGGCQLQHVDDVAYAAYVVARIADALKAQNLEGPDIRAPHLSPPRTRRRASLKAQKWGKQILLGFNEASSHRLVDIHDCAVLHPDLMGLVAPLRRLLGAMMGGRGQAEVQLTLLDQGVDVLLKDVTVEGMVAIEALNDFAAQHRLGRLSLDEGYGAEPRYVPEPATITLGGVAVPFPQGSFLQATADGETALVGAVREGVSEAYPVADLFCGLGTFALPLAANGAQVYAVEGARDALLALSGGARQAGIALTTEHRDLFRRPLTAAELAHFNAVVIDPPRAGAKEQVAELVRSSVPRIISVSCNPATFARDAAML
ncbi:MAG: class I SAM-dependent RNA methyltransferase, partial [Alphaproteobacteria bacterium]|nr:class I SAM-dependent RNA methyltransferase [Alphaproteobacteria bacterium]